MSAEVILGAFGFICAAILLAGAYALYQNERTCKDRLGILDAIEPLDPLWSDYMRAFKAVSYDDHYRARLLLRDPRALYPLAIRHLLFANAPHPHAVAVPAARSGR